MFLKIIIFIIICLNEINGQLNETNETTTATTTTPIQTTQLTTTTKKIVVYSLKLLNLNYLESNRIMKFNWSTNLTTATISNYYFECSFDDNSSFRIGKTIENEELEETFNLNIPMNVSGNK